MTNSAPVIHAICDVALVLCSADATFLFVGDPQTNRSTCIASAGMARVSNGLLPSETGTHGEAYIANESHPRFSALSHVDTAAREFLVVPFPAQSGPPGAIIAARHRTQSFTSADLRNAIQLSDLAGPALQIDVTPQSEALSRNFVSQIKDYVIFATDPQGSPVSWNEGVEAVLGYHRAEFIGSSVELPFLPEDIAAGIPERELRTARDTGSASDDRWLRRKDGGTFFAVGRTTRILGTQGECAGFTKVFRDETERVLVQRMRDESEAKFRTLVQNISDYAIFMLDAEGRVTQWTEGAQRVKGYSSEEVLGKHFRMFYTPEDIASDEPDRELRQAARMGRTEREGWRIRKGGAKFWVDEIATVVRDDSGELLGFTKISRDLTERKRSEEALRLADRRKDEFLATLAHELRNPLAPIRTALDILRLNGGTSVEEPLRIMDRQLTHMVRLVDDLLDVGRISGGKLNLRSDRMDLREVIASSVESAETLIVRRQHVLLKDLPPTPIYVNGDYHRLAQVFANLLTNAAKYTELGGQLRLVARSDMDEAVVTVSDTGIGIPREDLPHVFDLFSQVRSHQGRTEGGLGVGLALVRSIVGLHGGSVAVKSAGAGEGSVFTVRLPLGPGPDSSDAGKDQDRSAKTAYFEETRPEHLQRLPRRRVLVVDDNVDAALMLATFFEMEGQEVTVAHDGEEAILKAQSFRPDIVFLDLGMPKVDGIEAAKSLRALPEGAATTLVALTGWGQSSDRKRTEEAGFDYHLVKPVDPDALLNIIVHPPSS